MGRQDGRPTRWRQGGQQEWSQVGGGSFHAMSPNTWGVMHDGVESRRPEVVSSHPKAAYIELTVAQFSAESR